MERGTALKEKDVPAGPFRGSHLRGLPAKAFGFEAGAHGDDFLDSWLPPPPIGKMSSGSFLSEAGR